MNILKTMFYEAGSAFRYCSSIDVGAGGTGGTRPQDFAINKEVAFLVLKNAPFSQRKMPSKSLASSSLRYVLRPWTLMNILLNLHVLFQNNIETGGGGAFR